MNESITAKTKGAKIVKLGHTKGPHYGNNPFVQKAGKAAPTELKAR
jgi:hypothetical protein